MKHVIKIVILFVIICITFLLVSSIYKKIEVRATVKKNTELLPHFSFSKVGRGQFSDNDLVFISHKVIINYFNPECEHCQYMASSFAKNAAKFNDISLLMVTIADSASAAKFITDFHLDSLQNLIIVRDAELQFGKIFGTTVIPSFFIYKGKKLVKKIIGETKIDNLLY